MYIFKLTSHKVLNTTTWTIWNIVFFIPLPTIVGEELYGPRIFRGIRHYTFTIAIYFARGWFV